MTSKRANVLVVILLAAVGIALLIPAIRHVRAQANGQETVNRMKKLALAVYTCNDVHKFLPPAYDAFADITYPASLHVHLLRFIEQDAVYKSFLQNGQGKTDASVAGFHSPSDATLGRGEGVQNYAANLRVFSDAGVTSYGGTFVPVPLSAVMPGHASMTTSFPDGTSNTICFTTKVSACSHQSSVAGIVIDGGSHYDANPTSPFAAFFGENPAEKPAHPSDPDAAFQLAPQRFECRVWPLMGQSFGPHGIPVAMGDGSVRTISPTVDPSTWNQALQPNDGDCRGGGPYW